MGEPGKDYRVSPNGKYTYCDLTATWVTLNHIPKEPALWKEHNTCDKRAEQTSEKLPYSEFAWHIVKEKCEKEYFESPNEQLKYLSEVLDRYKSVIKELNAEIKKQDEIFNRINQERKRINRPPYGKSSSKALELRDYIFEDYREIKLFLDRIGTPKPAGDVETEQDRFQHKWILNPDPNSLEDFIKDFIDLGWFGEENRPCIENIRVDNFTNSLKTCGKHKLLVRCTHAQFKFFYKCSYEYNAFENLNQEWEPNSYGVFFESHCLKWDNKQKKYVFLTAKKVTDGARRVGTTNEDEKNAREIFEKYKAPDKA